MSNNTNYGIGSLSNNTTGENNTAVGSYSLYNNLDASCNTAVGSNASYFNTTGAYNSAFGAGALTNNSTGSRNTAVGSSALEGFTPNGSVGDRNVAIGAQALYKNSGTSNTAVGICALLNNTSGGENIAVGDKALMNNISGNNNIGIGNYALSSNSAYYDNVCIGYRGLQILNNGSQNTSIGNRSFESKQSGVGNIALGYASGGSDISGNYNTYLGSYTNKISNSPLRNSTAIGCNAIIDDSQQMVLGGSDIIISNPPIYPSVKIPGKYLGIGGIYNPTTSGTVDISGTLNVNFSSYSPSYPCCYLVGYSNGSNTLTPTGIWRSIPNYTTYYNGYYDGITSGVLTQNTVTGVTIIGNDVNYFDVSSNVTDKPDGYYIINPGYKINFYSGVNYTGSSSGIENLSLIPVQCNVTFATQSLELYVYTLNNESWQLIPAPTTQNG